VLRTVLPRTQDCAGARVCTHPRCTHDARGVCQRARVRRLHDDSAGQRRHVHPAGLAGCRTLPYPALLTCLDAFAFALIRSPRSTRPSTRSTNPPTAPCVMPRSFNSSSTFPARVRGAPLLCTCGERMRARTRGRACPRTAHHSVSSHRPWETLTSQCCVPRISARRT
jgi:hypothetical protein